MLQKNIHAPRNSGVHCFPRAFSKSYLFLLALSFLFCICSVSYSHFVLMFANPCESAQKSRNLLFLNLFCYTPRTVQGSEIVESPKLRKREHEKGRKLGRGRAAPTPPPFPFFPVLRSFSCVFHLRVIPTI